MSQYRPKFIYFSDRKILHLNLFDTPTEMMAGPSTQTTADGTGAETDPGKLRFSLSKTFNGSTQRVQFVLDAIILSSPFQF